MGASLSQVDIDLLVESNRRDVCIRAFDASILPVHVEELKGNFKGNIYTPHYVATGDIDHYNIARTRPFNKDARGFPILILSPVSVQDIQSAIKFVLKYGNGIKLCVASGCHSVKCMLDQSIVIDMKLINNITINPENMTVDVDGGCTLGMVDAACKDKGYWTTFGTYPGTGVGGLTLGGGFGYLARRFGLVVDNFLEAEVILANGEVVIANDNNEYKDLMIGLRGGGGNFGVVSKFTFRIYKVDPFCIGGSVVYLAPTQAAALEIALNFDNLVQDLPNDVAGLMVLPAGAPVVPTLWCYTGASGSVSDVPHLQRAQNLGGWFKVQNDLAPISYHSDLQMLTSTIAVAGYTYQSVVQLGQYDKPLSPAAFDALLQHTRRGLPNTLTKAVVVMVGMGGKIATSDDGTKTSISQSARSARYFCLIDVYFKPELGQKSKEDAKAWVQEVSRVLDEYKSKSAFKYVMEDNVQSHPDKSFHTIEAIVKLSQLKAKYDPTNFFKENINITPAVEVKMP